MLSQKKISETFLNPGCKCSVWPPGGLLESRGSAYVKARLSLHKNLSSSSFVNGNRGWSRGRYHQLADCIRATSEGEKASQVEQITEEAKKVLEEAVDDVKSSAADTASGDLGGPEKAKDLLLTAAQQLKEQAGALRSQASNATEQFVESAGKQAGLTAEQLKEETDKTAAHVLAEAERAAEELRKQSEKAAAQLAETAHETAEIAKDGLGIIAENSPESIKEIAEVAIHAHSKEAARKGAVIHDFCLGIPYGALLAVGGLVWFLLSGSLNALRFGTILGGVVLAVSVQSLRVWQQGKPTTSYIVAQAVIAFILLLKQGSKFFQTGAVFPTAISALVSGIMVAFYAYVVLAGGPPKKKERLAES